MGYFDHDIDHIGSWTSIPIVKIEKSMEKNVQVLWVHVSKEITKNTHSHSHFVCMPVHKNGKPIEQRKKDARFIHIGRRHTAKKHINHVEWFMIHLWWTKCGLYQIEIATLPILLLTVHLFFLVFVFSFRMCFPYNNYCASFSWIDWHSNRFFSINHKLMYSVWNDWEFISNVFFPQNENKNNARREYKSYHICRMRRRKTSKNIQRQYGAYASEKSINYSVISVSAKNQLVKVQRTKKNCRISFD